MPLIKLPQAKRLLVSSKQNSTREEWATYQVLKIFQNRNLANLIKARLKMENANQEKRERKEEKKREEKKLNYKIQDGGFITEQV